MKNMLMMVVSLLSVASAFGAVKTFTGGVSELWSNKANWEGGACPVNGDSVVIATTAGSVAKQRTTADIPGLEIVDLTFNGVGKQDNGVAYASDKGTTYQSYLGGAFKLTGNFTMNSKVRFNLQAMMELSEGNHEFWMLSGDNVARLDVVGAGTISGSGAMTLVQGLYIPYSDTSFAGGFTARSGTHVYAFVSKPFGTGKAVLEKGMALTMYKDGINVPNDIDFYGEGTVLGNVFLKNSCAFSGDVNLYGQQRIKADSASVVTMTFKGSVTQKTTNYFVTNLGVSDFRHEIIFDTVANLAGATLWMDGPGSTVRLRKAGNVFSVVRLVGGQLFFEVPGACCEQATLKLGGSSANNSSIFVEGTQIAQRLESAEAKVDGGCQVTSRNGGTLVIRGASDYCKYRGDMTGKLNFVWDPANSVAFYGESPVYTLSGALVISNGTFNLENKAASLPNISGLTLARGTKLVLPSGAKINSDLETLDLAPDCTFPSGGIYSFTVGRLYIEGVPQAESTVFTGGTAAEGQVHLDGLPANVTVRTRMIPGPGTRTVWNGRASNDALTEAGNWADLTTPRFWEKTLMAVIGGSSATLSGDTILGGVSFENGQDFAFSGSHALDLFWSGLSMPSPSTVTFNCPIRIGGNQTWTVAPDNGTAGRIDFRRTISDGEMPGQSVVKAGGGSVWLCQPNDFTGDLVVSNGQVVVASGASLGSSASGKVSVCRRTTDYHPSLRVYANNKIERPIEFSGPDSNYYPFMTDVEKGQSGVVELAGKLTFLGSDFKRLRAVANTTLVFSGGVESPDAMFYVQGAGKYVITNTPINVQQIYSDVKADFTIATSGNKVSQKIWMSKPESVLRFGVDNPFEIAPPVHLRNGGVLDLDGHNVRLASMLQGENKPGVIDGEVRSAKPGTLMLNGGAAQVQVTGAASLELNGPSNFTIVEGVSTSTGHLLSRKASLVLGQKAEWRAGTVVCTNAGAAVLLNPGAKLGRKVDVYLATGGKLTLYPPVGQSGEPGQFRCRNLYLDGVQQPVGTYGAASSAARFKSDTYFMANHQGVLTVSGEGMAILVR